MPRGYEVERILTKPERLRAVLPKNSRLVALDERGEDAATPRFATLLRSETTFIIGHDLSRLPQSAPPRAPDADRRALSPAAIPRARRRAPGSRRVAPRWRSARGLRRAHGARQGRGGLAPHAAAEPADRAGARRRHHRGARGQD